VVMSRFVTVSLNQPSHLSYFENCCVQWWAAGLNKVCEKKGGWVIYFFCKQCSATYLLSLIIAMYCQIELDPVKDKPN
jgi:hypothetical protein